MSVDKLSPREREVCRCLVLHGHNKKTASLMGISETTARWYLRVIKRKLGVQTLVQIALIWDRANRFQGVEHANTSPWVDGQYRPATRAEAATEAGATHTE